ncbi:integrase catalytic domain-containing protein [Trichonephila clavipes]|uniref:Integrase catalytic domain-containing protein n=1 Tax=Trichonephila clavipes TaxID=2585209 RepID=A0A8X6UQ69_TRICX|nr:integrase catalytic domain-containing protein [Trichonephila clavipes]
MNHLRESFWILKARKLIRQIIQKCTRCKRFSAQKTEVVPSSLPKDRVSNSKIFQVVGVDLAGPLHLKDRHHQEINKRIRHVQTIREQLRKRFRIEYLGQLREQTQHHRKLRPLTVGEVVAVENSLKNRTLWSLARVIQLIPGKDGHVRVARVKTETGELGKKWAEQFCWNGDRRSLSAEGTIALLPTICLAEASRFAESGRGNGLGQSENKRPETRRS